MAKIMKNDGTWEAKPSGLKKGNLTAWRDMMFEARPEPEVDDIIVDKTTTGEIIGYLCTVADGYNSYWKRVAKPLLVERSSFSAQQKGGWGKPQSAPQKAQIFYTERAKGSFAPISKYNEPPMDFDPDIPF